MTYSSMSAALLLLLAALALTAAHVPPPAIAELAPQAVQQIKDAPSEQSSELGTGDGGSGLDRIATTTSTTPESLLGPGVAATTTTLPAIERARVRRCVGDPPRQTEDPQSPPCVPFWQGNNGGATSKGVTENEIRVVQTGGAGAKTAAIYQNYFNKRFEFYGRKLNIIQVGSGDDTCASQKAAAVQVDAVQAFAVIDSANGNKACFHQELARRGVVSTTTNILFSEAELADLHPFMWQYLMGHEQLFGAIGDMFCARLAGAPAVHAQDPLLQRTRRKVGVVLHEPARDTAIDLAPLERALAACGEEPAVTFRHSVGADPADEGPAAQNAVLQMKTEGVTTVVCLCTIFVEQYLSVAATNQGYFPEWILSSFLNNDQNLLIKLFWTSEQRPGILGLTAGPPMRDHAYEPYYYTIEEADPSADPATVAQAANAYRGLLPLVSGIQMAGPNLTPETFAAALGRTRFPYPQDDPSHSGDVGFDGDHTMTDDLSEFWWSEVDRGPDLKPASNGETGAMCFVDGGDRRRAGKWPRDPDPFFRRPCDPDAGPA